MLTLSNLSIPKGSRKARKRLGRGEASGVGKTSGRGHKGQKARSGGGVSPGFEGGQMPLQRRLPKRGFTNIFKKKWTLVNISQLVGHEDPATRERRAEFSPFDLLTLKIVHDLNNPIKLLAVGEIDYPVAVTVQAASKSAIAKIESVGGKVILSPLQEVWKLVDSYALRLEGALETAVVALREEKPEEALEVLKSALEVTGASAASDGGPPPAEDGAPEEPGEADAEKPPEDS
jgi:large subunit ribosomal protein L15